MNAKELGIIRRTAEGFRAALADLSDDDGDRKLSEALQAFQEPYGKPLSSQAAGYYAAMLMAWQDRGCPDLLA